MFRLLSRRLQPRIAPTTGSRGFSQIQRYPNDFRPQWVYTMSRLATHLSIPVVALYAIFFYDFGDDDHVFQPIRRWAARQKASFFTLSPAEQRLLESEEAQKAKKDT